MLRPSRSILWIFAALLIACGATYAFAGRRWRKPPAGQPAAQRVSGESVRRSTDGKASLPRSAAGPLIDPIQARADILALHAGGEAAIGDEAEFAAALDRLLAEKHGVNPAELAASPSAEKPATGSEASELGAALRQATRHFEMLAADLELERNYTAADDARRTAAAIRQEARRLDQGAR